MVDTYHRGRGKASVCERPAVGDCCSKQEVGGMEGGQGGGGQDLQGDQWPEQPCARTHVMDTTPSPGLHQDALQISFQLILTVVMTTDPSTCFRPGIFMAAFMWEI